jgi:type I restriction enzyme, R subunit
MRTVLRSQPSYEGYVQKYFNKTVKFIHESTELYNVQKELPSIHFDEQYLKNLEEKVKSREEKAANIVFTLNRLRPCGSTSKPSL